MNKCAIVTGGSSGFGRALSLLFVSKGIKVVAGDISVVEGKQLEEEANRNGNNLAFVKCDVTSEQDLKNLFKVATEKFGGAQIMVNNAGIGGIENFERSTSKVDPIISVNLTAVFKGTSLAIQHFEEQKKKNPNFKYDFSIINISSFSAIIPLTISPIYSVTKMGVLYLTHNLRYLYKKGIRVNAVAPAFSPTKILDYGKGDPRFEKVVGSQGDLVPIETVTNAILKLCTDTKYYGDVIAISPKGEQLLPKSNILGAKL